MKRKEMNDEMVKFGKFLLCLFSFLFQFSQDISKSSHVAHEYNTIVYSFFILKRFAFRASNACNATLARSQKSTYNAMPVRSP